MMASAEEKERGGEHRIDHQTDENAVEHARFPAANRSKQRREVEQNEIDRNGQANLLPEHLAHWAEIAPRFVIVKDELHPSDREQQLAGQSYREVENSDESDDCGTCKGETVKRGDGAPPDGKTQPGSDEDPDHETNEHSSHYPPPFSVTSANRRRRARALDGLSVMARRNSRAARSNASAAAAFSAARSTYTAARSGRAAA